MINIFDIHVLVDSIVNFFNEVAAKPASTEINLQPLLPLIFGNDHQKVLKDLNAAASQTGFLFCFVF
jgi:hypothetical protein